jgi:hypothetical protein
MSRQVVVQLPDRSLDDTGILARDFVPDLAIGLAASDKVETLAPLEQAGRALGG